MALKPITRQEQIIAGKNLEPITRMEWFLKEYGGGSSDGEYFETVGGDTLTWDGNTEGRYGIDILGVGAPTHYLVSDIVPSTSDLANGFSLAVSLDGESYEVPFTSENITDVGGVLMCGAEVETFYIAQADNIDIDGIVFNKKGVYLLNADGMCHNSLTINGYTGFPTTKLKEEYLPEQSGGGGSMVVTIAETDTQTYTSDKTFAEIEKAINDGKGVMARFAMPGGVYNYYKLVTHMTGQAVVFDLIQYVAYTKELQILMVVISADNKVTAQITALKMAE